MSIQGTIAHWDQSKGYGYIAVDNQDTKVFFHASDLENGAKEPFISEPVIFRLGSDEKGAMCAVEVERPLVFNFSLAIALWFCCILLGSVVLLDFPLIACVFYLAMSTITYIGYAFDKQAMLAGGARIPESVFHMLNIFGGWLGALCAQVFMHHKYHDLGFKFLFWLTLALNIIIYCWALTDHGAQVLTTTIASITV